MKKIFLISILSNIVLWAQFETIQQFPYTGNPDYGVGQLLDMGENHLLFFFPTDDSLKLSHSYDGGVTWQEPIGILEASITWVETYKTESDRILVSFVVLRK